MHAPLHTQDVIVTGGVRVRCADVEARLASHPAVARVAVIGVPHVRWGETVKAIVVPAPGVHVSADQLIAYARNGLAHYKCPTSVGFVDALPMTSTGKVQKLRLREPYWSSPARRAA